MKNCLIGILLVFIYTTSLSGQNSLTVYRIEEPRKEAKLRVERIFEFMTIDSVLHDNIIESKNGAFYLRNTYEKKEVKKVYLNKERTDSTYNTYINTYSDTLMIPLKKVIKVTYFPNGGKRWPITFTYLAALSILSSIAIPVNAINHGKEGALTSAAVVGILMAITIPPTLIGRRKIEYNTKSEWKFKQFDQ